MNSWVEVVKISKWGDIAQKHTLQVIDESFEFQYVGTGLEYYNGK